MSVERQLLMSAGGVTQYTIPKSLRFRSSASAYLNRTPSSAGNRQTWTWSAWVKRGTLGAAQTLLSSDVGTSNTTWLELGFDAADTFTITAYSADSNTTSAVFRDPSSWYHIVVAFDSTQATAANRCKIYVNGVQQTLTGSGFTLNASYGINNNQIHGIGYRNWASGVGRYFDGYMAEVNFIDGQALTPSSFGETSSTTGVWIPKRYSGSYGTNGFYLTFNNTTSTTTLGYDTSGNSNNWTTNNLSLTTGATYDSMLDSPTNYDNGGNGVGNYAVLNPLDKGSITVSNGNLTLTNTSGTWTSCKSTFGITSGKWYWEVTATNNSGSIGIGKSSASNNSYVGSDASGWGYLYNGNKVTSGSSTAYGSSYTTNDVIGVAFDADAGTLVFYKNNTSQGTAFSSLTSGPYFPVLSLANTGDIATANFGQRSFAYTPPSGYKALNTQNLPVPSIVNGAAQFAATTYTGTGSSLSVSGAAFQPDLVWIKSRSAATDNKLTDVIRGTTNALISNSTSAATTDAGGVTAFNSNGFTIGTTAAYNTNAATYIAWQWKANGTGVSNTAGSISSTVSANTTAGFSVVAYTGTGANATVGHGLGVAPSMVITKKRSSTSDWGVYHSSLTSAAYYLLLDTTAAQASGATYWNSTAPTSTVFSVGTADPTNISTATYVAYCFAAIAGYSAFGSYTGNGSADGPFVFLGFRPKWIIFKPSSATGEWRIYDTSRNTYNAANSQLYADLSNAEGTNAAYAIDILSNGIKFRGTGDPNASGVTYIYAAFAENPFKNALAR